MLRLNFITITFYVIERLMIDVLVKKFSFEILVLLFNEQIIYKEKNILCTNLLARRLSEKILTAPLLS